MKQLSIPLFALVLVFITACTSQPIEPVAVATSNPTKTPTEIPSTATASPTIELVTPDPTSTKPAATATAVPSTATALPTSTPAPEFASVDEIVFGLDQLESYQFTLDYEMFEGETDTVKMKISAEGSVSKDPHARHVTMFLQQGAVEAPEEPLAASQIDDTMYAFLPGLGCMVTSASATGEEEFFNMAEVQTFVSSLREIERRYPNELINGIDAKRYTFDQTALDDETAAQVTRLDGELYISEATGQVLRIVMQGNNPYAFDMADEPNPNDTFDFQYDMTHLNEPVEVPIPSGCKEMISSSGLPKVGDAQNITLIGGVESYQSAMSMDEITRFYRDALPQENWLYSAEDSSAIGTLVTETYYRGGETLQVLLVSHGDLTAVTLMTESE